MKSNKEFFTRILILIFFILITSSCAKKLSINQSFQKKYGKQVERIKVERTPPKQLAEDNVVERGPSAEDWRNSEKIAGEEYYAYVDVTKFSEDRMPQNFLPNGESYQNARAENPSNKLPEGMFEIAYNTNLHSPFRIIGAEFDGIEIPAEDAYNVKTAMSEKPYFLVGNEKLQRNINQINSQKTSQDIEISQILIKEEKQLKRKQKMIKIFGQDSVEMAFLKEDIKKAEKKSTLGKNASSSKGSNNTATQASASGFIRTTSK